MFIGVYPASDHIHEFETSTIQLDPPFADYIYIQTTYR